jgi:phosphate transport system protein
MSFAAANVETFQQAMLINYLVSMAKTVEASVDRALDALLRPGVPEAASIASTVFLTEPRINEMEVVIDEHAVRLLQAGGLSDEEIRLVVATLKLTNDLERIGDLAVNIGERVLTLNEMPGAEGPVELSSMVTEVRAMLKKSLGALVFRNADLAIQVLESDDIVDHYQDRVFEHLLSSMTENPGTVGSNMQFVLAARYLERIADHATNIAEDIIFWVRGLDVRHGRGRDAASNDSSRSDFPISSPVSRHLETGH